MRLTTEQWLHQAWRRLTPLVEGAIADALGEAAEHYPAPQKVQLSVGYWPKIEKVEQPWGFCADPTDCRDGETYTVFISPEVAGDHRRTTLMLGIILHEMFHVWLTNEHGHNRRFQKVTHAAGFRKPYGCIALDSMTNKLRTTLRQLGHRMGPCPWKALKGS